MNEETLKKIKDEEVRLAVAELLEQRNKAQQELETARQTAKALKEKADKLEVVNTDLYARVVAGTVDNNKKQGQEVKQKTFSQVADDIAQKLKAK